MAETKELVYTTYSQKLQSPKWQIKRLKILERDNFTCVCCGDKETTLHVHHLEYKGNPWEVNDDKLITTCKHCHKAIEHYKIAWLPCYKISKKYYVGYPQFTYLIIITDDNIQISYIHNNEVNNIICFSHKGMSDIMHDLIDFWTKTQQQHFLTDKRKL